VVKINLVIIFIVIALVLNWVGIFYLLYVIRNFLANINLRLANLEKNRENDRLEEYKDSNGFYTRRKRS
jgi:hypothetical protein